MVKRDPLTVTTPVKSAAEPHPVAAGSNAASLPVDLITMRHTPGIPPVAAAAAWGTFRFQQPTNACGTERPVAAAAVASSTEETMVAAKPAEARVAHLRD